MSSKTRNKQIQLLDQKHLGQTLVHVGTVQMHA